ncbi:CDP-glucose 4,6-dehydratase [Flammeovirgaceae bacterium SG7u.111]|nr:CDP-glucose 4,6-dehydratase [Flammeovirgaceae bacterium SG7u.132]WPO37637.1 CDP-glucose 4,6-dehydratase [Flammeovirgaceae bacterium SG7u.111]
MIEVSFEEAYKGKKVLVTGHTGFKGSWMTQWLVMLGADVYGYSLEPNTSPSLFDQLELEKDIDHKIGDIRDFATLKSYIGEVDPDIIFHLAAQPLVRYSYREPLETTEVNVMGTVNVLDAVRQLGISTSVVVITTDKSYENKEWLFGYRENDPMGGHDVYSASKGACEIMVSSWRSSFFSDNDKVKVASVRAGNVIGGGDWAEDRIVPDCIRFLSEGKTIEVRNPHATRPWQHVLEPIHGYLALGTQLLSEEEPPRGRDVYCGGFNFGPLISSNKNVGILVEEVLKNWGEGKWEDHSNVDALHEASLLNLTIDKVFHLLNWIPRWNFEETIKQTVDWYKEVYSNPESAKEITLKQIKLYDNSKK